MKKFRWAIRAIITIAAVHVIFLLYMLIKMLTA